MSLGSDCASVPLVAPINTMSGNNGGNGNDMFGGNGAW